MDVHRKQLYPAIFVATALIASMVLDIPPASAFSTTVTQDDPKRELIHDWSPSRAIETGVVNSCVIRDSDVKGREHLCRVVDGYEEKGDKRNWLIDFSARDPEGPLASEGSNGDPHGILIVMDDGATYEGCTWFSPSNDFLCDYRIRKPIVLKTSGNAREYVLRKLWDWAKYAGNTYGCAQGIGSVMVDGFSISQLFLANCFDGPLESK